MTENILEKNEINEIVFTREIILKTRNFLNSLTEEVKARGKSITQMDEKQVAKMEKYLDDPLLPEIAKESIREQLKTNSEAVSLHSIRFSYPLLKEIKAMQGKMLRMDENLSLQLSIELADDDGFDSQSSGISNFEKLYFPVKAEEVKAEKAEEKKKDEKKNNKK